MIKKFISLFLVSAIIATALFACLTTAAGKTGPLSIIITESKLPNSVKSIFNAEQLTIRLTINPAGKSQGTISSEHSSYRLTLEGKLEPVSANRNILVGALFGTVETTQGIKDVGIHCEVGGGVSVLTLTIDGMGADYIIFGDLANPARKSVIEHYKKRLSSPKSTLDTLQGSVFPRSEESKATEAGIASTSVGKMQHREHKGTALFRQLNGVSIGGRTGILNAYATPPNYDPMHHPLQGVLQLRLWARTQEIMQLLASPWVGVNSVTVSMKLKHTQPGHAGGEFLSHSPPNNSTSIPPLITALFSGLETANPLLRAAQFIIGSLSTMPFGIIRVTRQNWDGVYSGDQIITWDMGGGPSPNYPAPANANDSQLISGSANYGMNSSEEGGITVRGLWTIRNWAGVPTGNQWNHETKAQLRYDVMVFDQARGDWAIVLYWTEWQVVNVPVVRIN